MHVGPQELDALVPRIGASVRTASTRRTLKSVSAEGLLRTAYARGREKYVNVSELGKTWSALVPSLAASSTTDLSHVLLYSVGILEVFDFHNDCR